MSYSEKSKTRKYLGPLLFIFPLERVIKTVQEILQGLKLNGINELLVYNDYDNFVGKSVNTITRNPKAPNFTPTEAGLYVNAENTK